MSPDECPIVENWISPVFPEPEAFGIPPKEEKSKVVRNSAHSEDYELKEQAMDSILKLVGMQEMANLSRD